MRQEQAVMGSEQVEVARGIVNYSSALKKIKGKKTSEIEKVLLQGLHEVIHRDNFTLLKPSDKGR